MKKLVTLLIVLVAGLLIDTTATPLPVLPVETTITQSQQQMETYMGIKLTQGQRDSIEGQCLDLPNCNSSTFISCIQDINGDWFTFLSDSDIDVLEGADANPALTWLLNEPLTEYVPPAN